MNNGGSRPGRVINRLDSLTRRPQAAREEAPVRRAIQDNTRSQCSPGNTVPNESQQERFGIK